MPRFDHRSLGLAMACGHLQVELILVRSVSSPSSEKIASTSLPESGLSRTASSPSLGSDRSRATASAFESDAVAKGRRAAGELHRLAAVHAIGNRGSVPRPVMADPVTASSVRPPRQRMESCISALARDLSRCGGGRGNRRVVDGRCRLAHDPAIAAAPAGAGRGPRQLVEAFNRPAFHPSRRELRRRIVHLAPGNPARREDNREQRAAPLIATPDCRARGCRARPEPR